MNNRIKNASKHTTLHLHLVLKQSEGGVVFSVSVDVYVFISHCIARKLLLLFTLTLIESLYHFIFKYRQPSFIKKSGLESFEKRMMAVFSLSLSHSRFCIFQINANTNANVSTCMQVISVVSESHRMCVLFFIIHFS